MTTIIATLLGVAATGVILLRQVALWQRKEYRWDRLWAEFKESWWQQPAVWLTGVLVVTLMSTRGDVLRGIGWLGLGLLAIWLMYDGLRRGLYRPKPTPKALVILSIAIVILAALSIAVRPTALPHPMFWFIMSLTAIPAAAAASIIGTIASDIRKKQIISQAVQLRHKFSNLQVIGITGSYGKTSTKYFLHHLMSGHRQPIVMSAARRNETYVIAQDMLANIKPGTSTYIVEMAAYKTGEIKKSADLTQPTIGVVTAIKNQHLALFGSLAKLAAAKWELIAALPPDGTAVLNADDPTIVKQAAGHQGRVVWYSLVREADVYASTITYQPTSSKFTLHIKEALQSVTIPLPGAGYVSAAVAAAAAAYAAGVPASEIFKRLVSVPTIPQTMVVATNSKGSTILDDSYSANEAGVLMAIEHLGRFPQLKKIVVLRPLIELGPAAARVHETIGQALAKANSEVFLVDVAGAADIERAAKAAGATHPIHRLSAPASLAHAVAEALDTETACLLENRLPDVVRAAALA